MADENNVEDRYMQFQQLQQQLVQIAEFVERLRQQQLEIETSIEALKELKETKINSEILAPIANGIFLKAELKDHAHLIVNIGAEVTAEKTIPEVMVLLEEQKERIAGNISEAESVLEQLYAQGVKISQEVESEVNRN